jgi:lysophospholipase L1-like esterase
MAQKDVPEPDLWAGEERSAYPRAMGRGRGRESSNKAASVGLRVLAAVTLGLPVFAISTANSTPPNSSAVLPTFTAKPAPTMAATTLDAARAVLATGKAVTISVLGDSTGNDEGEWVQLWAKHLGGTRAVTLYQWNSVRNDWIPQTDDYGSGANGVTIWNMSQPGATPDYATGRMKEAQPIRPDLVILNYGHNGSTARQWDWLDALTAASQGLWPGKVPTVVVLQNPETTTRAATAAASMAQVGDWAKAHQAPSVNVGAAFVASGNVSSLLIEPEGVHPNADGSALWEKTVAAALG